MPKKDIILGDPHVSRRQPYASALKIVQADLVRTLSEHPGSRIWIAGDLYNSGHPLPSEVEMAREFLSALAVCGELHIIAGNHDYATKNGRLECALDTVGDLATIWREPVYHEDSRMMLMPFLPMVEGRSMYDVYTPKFVKTRIPETAAYLLGHFFDETLSGFSDGVKAKIKHVDLSGLPATVTRILGHDHTPKPGYIGSLFPTMFEVDAPVRRILLLSGEAKVAMPITKAVDFQVFHSIPEFEAFRKAAERRRPDVPTSVIVATSDAVFFEEHRNQHFLEDNLWLHDVKLIRESETQDPRVAFEGFEARSNYTRLGIFLQENGQTIPERVQSRLLEIMKESECV